MSLPSGYVYDWNPANQPEADSDPVNTLIDSGSLGLDLPSATSNPAIMGTYNGHKALHWPENTGFGYQSSFTPIWTQDMTILMVGIASDTGFQNPGMRWEMFDGPHNGLDGCSAELYSYAFGGQQQAFFSQYSEAFNPWRWHLSYLDTTVEKISDAHIFGARMVGRLNAGKSVGSFGCTDTEVDHEDLEAPQELGISLDWLRIQGSSWIMLRALVWHRALSDTEFDAARTWASQTYGLDLPCAEPEPEPPIGAMKPLRLLQRTSGQQPNAPRVGSNIYW